MVQTPVIFAIANQKGGVGKTTTAVNLAASLAAAEQRTLLVDCDPQGNASSGVGVRRQTVERSLYDVLIGQATMPEVVRRTAVPLLDVVPATQDLVAVELELVDAGDRATRLRDALRPHVGNYDYVVLDCPPSLGLLTLNALTTAGRVLVPLQCEYYALEGLTHLMATIDRVKGAYNPELGVEGIVLTMFDGRNSLTHQVADEVRAHFHVFESIIPRNVKLSEAPSHGQPALLYDSQSKGAQGYLSLAREILDATGGGRKKPRAKLRVVTTPASGTGQAPAHMSQEPSNPRPPRRALGRGLDALLPAPPSPSGPERSAFICPIEKVVPQAGQPRQYFDEQELAELTESIREHGLIEPLIVRRVGGGHVGGHPQTPGADRFELIAGERRWRAAQRAGLKDFLVVVKDVSPKEAFELALVENVQRADLNPIEIAEAFDRLIKEYSYTQQTLAERVGKDRVTVTNALRLLKLPPRIRTMVIGRELTEGHARALLGAPTDKSMAEIAEKTVRGKLPVRRVEQLVRSAKVKESGPSPAGKEEDKKPERSPSVRDLEARLMRRLGTRVEVRDQGGKGELVVTYGSLDELDRVLEILGA